MLNAKGVKCWKGPQKLVKMSNLVTVKIPLRSQFFVKVSNLRIGQKHNKASTSFRIWDLIGYLRPFRRTRPSIPRRISQKGVKNTISPQLSSRNIWTPQITLHLSSIWGNLSVLFVWGSVEQICIIICVNEANHALSLVKGGWVFKNAQFWVVSEIKEAWLEQE